MTDKQPQYEILDEDTLSYQLIEAQYALRRSCGRRNGKSLVILVSGIELAGKGEAVKELRGWVDPRYLKVKADPPYLLTGKQPFWLPYVSSIPAEGQILVMFGNWYSDLLATAMHVSKPLDETMFDAYVDNMRTFEQDLKNNHVDVIKVWFDLSWKSLQKRLGNIDASEQHFHRLLGLDWHHKKQYDNLQKLRQRFTQDWFMIDCEQEIRRDQQFAQYILQALKNMPNHQLTTRKPWPVSPIPELLLYPATQAMDAVSYKTALKSLTRKVAEALRLDTRNVVIVFEGVDAAGKGGAIKRLVKKLDPREYEIYTISAPEGYERNHPYLWRFWTKLEANRKITIFDRSWYGRVLVERIEGFAKALEWQSSYAEINHFEQDLVDSQTVVIKFWLAISKEEQILRFKARQDKPSKHFKLTDEDWRNRDRWDDYSQAAADMFEHTSTVCVPWHIIATDDKYTARIAILKTILQQLKAV